MLSENQEHFGQAEEMQRAEEEFPRTKTKMFKVLTTLEDKMDVMYEDSTL